MSIALIMMTLASPSKWTMAGILAVLGVAAWAIGTWLFWFSPSLFALGMHAVFSVLHSLLKVFQRGGRTVAERLERLGIVRFRRGSEGGADKGSEAVQGTALMRRHVWMAAKPLSLVYCTHCQGRLIG